jgi:hypothetical protein
VALPPRAEGAAVLRVRLQVEHGKLGIGVLARRDPSQLLGEQAVEVTSAPVEVYLDLPDVRQIGSLMFRSWSAGEVPTRARILSIDTVLERAPPSPGLVIPMSLEALQAQNGGTAAAADGAVVLTTPRQQYAYAAVAAVALPPRAEGAAVLRVRLQVEHGKLGIGVLARRDPSQLLGEQAVEVTSAPVEVYLDLPDVRQIGSLMFRSWSAGEVPTRARILSIDMVVAR